MNHRAKKHWGVFINNQSDKKYFINGLLTDTVFHGFETLASLKGALFSKIALNTFILEEERHDRKIITSSTPQTLRSMSSGEQKKALLGYLLKKDPDFLILDNPFDNLDIDSQKDLHNLLFTVSQRTSIVQLISRKEDKLPFISHSVQLEGRSIRKHDVTYTTSSQKIGTNGMFKKPIPRSSKVFDHNIDALIKFKDVTVHYGDKPIVHHINWEIKPNEFWQLMGKNGSGKTTLLSMITGENNKGYGQELYIFGKKKGSGESIWDIKKRIGYFTPSMTDRFSGYHTLEHMLISGLHDSVGLYVKPSKTEVRLAGEWLQLIDLLAIKDHYFHDLSMGQQRLVMVVRAMIKHPLLLILDEPTAGLDDKSATLFIALVNKIAQESDTAIVFVSHREEKGLKPVFIYKLEMTGKGSIGKVIKQ
ncbi:MAG: ATP-binding cassette domain-containing protein [Bacteroidota bacterium]